MIVEMNFNTENMSIETAIRIACGIANAEHNDKVEDAGCGMFNVTTSLFGMDNKAIVQCYPKDEYKDVWIFVFKHGDYYLIKLSELPKILQIEVYKSYIKTLGLTKYFKVID